MIEALPVFRYHPDPVATGVVQRSGKICICCNQARGFIYVGPIYTVADLREKVCPWCIAEGSAATLLGATFADDYPLSAAGVPPEVIEEVHLRTPGYVSWQQEHWLAHCGDACEFQGYASREDVAHASQATREAWMKEYKQEEQNWLWVSEGYCPGGDSALYKFRCRLCQLVLFGWDLC